MLLSDEGDALIQQALSLYADVKLFQAERCLRQVEALCDAAERSGGGGGDAGAAAAAAARLRERLAHDATLAALRQRSAECTELLRDMDSEERWRVCYSSSSADSDTRVWYRSDGQAVHTLRCQSTLHADLLHMASLVFEVELQPSIWWFVRQAVEHARLNVSSKLVQTVYSAPWPLWDREVPILGYCVDGLDEDRCALLFFRSLREEDARLAPQLSAPPPLARTVRLDIRFAGMRFEPLAAGVTRVTILTNIDPKIAKVPPALLTWCSKSIMRFALGSLEWHANAFHSLPHAERARGSDPFYAWIRSRLGEYAALHGWRLPSEQHAGGDERAHGRAAAAEAAKAPARRRGSFDVDHAKAARPPVSSLFGLR